MAKKKFPLKNLMLIGGAALIGFPLLAKAFGTKESTEGGAAPPTLSSELSQDFFSRLASSQKTNPLEIILKQESGTPFDPTNILKQMNDSFQQQINTIKQQIAQIPTSTIRAPRQDEPIRHIAESSVYTTLQNNKVYRHVVERSGSKLTGSVTQIYPNPRPKTPAKVLPAILKAPGFRTLEEGRALGIIK